MAARRIKDRWIVDFYFRHPDGRRERIRETSPVNTRRGAESYERELREALLEGRRDRVEGEVPTLAAFWPAWIEGHAKANRQKATTIDSKESIYRNHLAPLLGRKRLDEITEEDVARLKGRLKDRSPKTVNNVLSVLSKLLKTAVRWKRIPKMPVEIELVKAAKPVMEFYQEEEFERLIEAARKISGNRLTFILLAGEAGLRAGEIMALEWSDVDLKNQSITVRQSLSSGRHLGAPKGGTSRVIPMTARLAAALRESRHLIGPRVLYRDGRRNAGKGLSQKTLQTWMEAIQKRAGLKADGRLHILRHTFCSRLAMRGAPAKAIQELAGHVNLSTTQRYMHLSPAARDGAIRLLEGGSGWAASGQTAQPKKTSSENH